MNRKQLMILLIIVMISPICLAQDYTVTYEWVIDHGEHKCFADEHHFLTAIYYPSTQVAAIRAHPGCDINGWGTTIHPLPYTTAYKDFSESAIGRATVVEATAYADHVNVTVVGEIYNGPDGSQSFGSSSWNVDYTYSLAAKQVDGLGVYNIIVYTGSPTPLPSDMSVCRIATNYLCNVHLQSGGTGDTGDMASADYQVGTHAAGNWIPDIQPGFYPGETGDDIWIYVHGQYNEIDGSLQYTPPDPIAAAYKPSTELTLNAQQTGLNMIFGAQYDISGGGCEPVVNNCICKMYWHDNVGIVPLILTSDSRPEYTFDLTFSSVAIPGDPTCTPIPIPIPTSSPGSIFLIISLISFLLIASRQFN